LHVKRISLLDWHDILTVRHDFTNYGLIVLDATDPMAPPARLTVSTLTNDDTVQLNDGEYDGLFINDQQGTILARAGGAVFKHLENYGDVAIDGFLDIEGAPGVNATYVHHAWGTVNGAGTFALSFHATATLEADFTNFC